MMQLTHLSAWFIKCCFVCVAACTFTMEFGGLFTRKLLNNTSLCNLMCFDQQGRKSMFKHGGIILGRNIHPANCGMYCAREGGFGGMLPREKIFKWCNLVRFGVYLDQILSLENLKNYYFLDNFFLIKI